MKKLASAALSLLVAPSLVALEGGVDSQDAAAYPPRAYRPAPRAGYRPVYRPGVPRFYRPAPVAVHPVPVYVPAPVYVQPAPAPVYVQPAPTQAPVVVSAPTHAAPQAEPDRELFALGVHASGVSVEGEKVGVSTAENPSMGGVGLHLRSRFEQDLGIELSADLLTGQAVDEDLTQTTVPLMAALTWHPLPTSRIQPYLLAGLGAHFTRLSYFGGDYNIDLTELAGQLGGGLEVFLTENVAIHADLRFNTVFRNVDKRESVHEDCLDARGEMVGFCDDIHFTGADDKVSLGGQVRAGVSWYF
jgi:opacity protein-like surface antigen